MRKFSIKQQRTSRGDLCTVREKKEGGREAKELRKIGLIFAIHSLIVVSYGQQFLQNLEFTRSRIAIRCSLQESERNRSHTAHTRSITFILDFNMYIMKYFYVMLICKRYICDCCIKNLDGWSLGDVTKFKLFFWMSESNHFTLMMKTASI